MSGIAFKTEEFGEALKDFVGQVVATDYALEPFGMKGAPDISRKEKVLAIQIQTDAYDKPQYELVSVERIQETVSTPEEEAILQYAIGWLEGAIDGEGSISISKSTRSNKRGYRYEPRVQICNTNIAFLEKAQIIIGGGRITGGRRLSNWSKKVEFTLEFSRPLMKKWLPLLALEVKEKQRMLLLDFLTFIEDRRNQYSYSYIDWYELDSYYAKMRLLNSGEDVFVPYWSRYRWYPPSRVKKTKWQYLIEALNQVGAMKDISIAGANDEERMKSFAQSLLGMTFRFQEQECESMVKVKGGAQKKFNLIIPVEYLGKKPIEAAATIRQEKIGEPSGPSAVM